ncbi:hypothetical protein G4X40_00105 [Rhodococcus sp. D2-41]|uniref:hypothetical protein n=1 Tax=Speluncibacter jeojiensis TaxID=2710754 RepID=UPI00240F57FE|nr:hypothetical protein [Rhodococcus sp. D2-41]MDG3008553.1 hypothetical protein [Rhodococcus sp. D2-41]
MGTASIRSGGAAILAALAAVLIGMCAGVVLVQPFTPDLAVAVTATDFRWWVLSHPLGAVAGAIMAPVACLATSRLRGRRLPAVTLGVVVVVMLAEVGLGRSDSVAVLVAGRYVEAVFAGAALGAAAAVLRTRRSATAALAAGTVAAFLLTAAAVSAGGPPRRYADYLEPQSSTTVYAGWLAVLAGVLLMVTIVVGFGSGADEHLPAVSWRPVAAVVLLAVGGVASAAAATAQTPTNWWLAGPALAFTLVVAGGAAMLLPGADGVVVFAATAITAVAAVAATVFDWAVLPDPTMVAALAVLILLGVAAGVRWRQPALAMVVLALILGCGTVPVADPGLLHAVLLLVGAPTVGVVVGSALPGPAASGSSVSTGLGALFLPGAAAALTGAYRGTWAVSGTDFGWTAYTPLTEVPPRASGHLPSLSDLSISGGSPLDAVTAWALAALILGCAGAAVLLRRAR